MHDQTKIPIQRDLALALLGAGRELRSNDFQLSDRETGLVGESPWYLDTGETLTYQQSRAALRQGACVAGAWAADEEPVIQMRLTNAVWMPFMALAEPDETRARAQTVDIDAVDK